MHKERLGNQIAKKPSPGMITLNPAGRAMMSVNSDLEDVTGRRALDVNRSGQRVNRADIGRVQEMRFDRFLCFKSDPRPIKGSGGV